MATRLSYGSRKLELRVGAEARAPAEHRPLRFEDAQTARRFLGGLAGDARNRLLLERVLGGISSGAVPFAAVSPLDRLARLVQSGRAVLLDVEWARTRAGHRRRVGKGSGGGGRAARSTDEIEWGESESRVISDKPCDPARSFHMQRTLTSRIGHVTALKIGTAELVADLALEVPGSWKRQNVVGAIEQVTWTEERQREAFDDVDPDEAAEALLEELDERAEAIADQLAEHLRSRRRARERARRAPSWRSPAARTAEKAIESVYGTPRVGIRDASAAAGTVAEDGDPAPPLPTDEERDEAWKQAVLAVAPRAAEARSLAFFLAEAEDPDATEDEVEGEAPLEGEDEDEPRPGEAAQRTRLATSLAEARRGIFPPLSAEEVALREIRKRRRAGLLSQRLASRRRSALSLSLRVSAKNKQSLRMLLQTEDFDDVEVKLELRVYEYDPIERAYHTALATTSGGLTAKAPDAFQIDDDPADEPARPVTYTLSLELATSDEPQELHLAHGKRKVHVLPWGEFTG